MAAYSAHLRGASRIYVIDRVPERLAAAKKIPCCTPVDFSAGEDAVDVIIRENGDNMVDRAIDAGTSFPSFTIPLKNCPLSGRTCFGSTQSNLYAIYSFRTVMWLFYTLMRKH